MVGYHKSDKDSNATWNESFKHNYSTQNILKWDMMIDLSDKKKQHIQYIMVGNKDKTLTVPIKTKNVKWIPHIILYAGSSYISMFGDIKLTVSQIDPQFFGEVVPQ